VKEYSEYILGTKRIMGNIDVKKIIEDQMRKAEEEYQKWWNIELWKSSLGINKPHRKGVIVGLDANSSHNKPS